MSFSIELPQTYTFYLRIDKGNRTFVDTRVEVPATIEGVAKAKRIVHLTMNEYALPIEPPRAAAPEPPLENQVLTDQADRPERDAAPAPPPEKKPEGVRGLLRLRCPECGNTFGTFLREYQTGVDCKCGHQIDLTGQLGRYHFVCPYCQQEGWGKTNLEDPEITVRCKCGEDVALRWKREAKEYQN